MKKNSKIAVVTGATSGIGTAVAKKFAEDDYIVVLVGRNIEAGQRLEDEIVQAGNAAIFFRCDVSKEVEIVELSKRIEELYGRVDVLFNNAGIMLASKEIERLPLEEWEATFSTNVESIYLVTKHLKRMIFNVKGCIINNASIAGMHSYLAGRSYAYSASKAAVIQFSRQMAMNYAEDSVRVNCICPGIIDTPILGERDRKQYSERIPLGYVGQPRDVAEVVSFLASQKAAYLTGVVLPIDGGASLR